MTNRPRRPDSLLRLGQSLAALKEKEAACAALGEVTRKYPRASGGVEAGVDREQKRISAKAAAQVCRADLDMSQRRHARRRPCPISASDANGCSRTEGCAGARARRFRRPGFDRPDVARGALAPRLKARAAPCRRHRRPRLAQGGGARGARGEEAGRTLRSSIARCAGPAQSRRPDCRPLRVRRATACWRRRRASSAQRISSPRIRATTRPRRC